MAAAAPSPLTSSIEKINGAKLSRLLIDGGTTVLRNVFDRHHPPANLAADLNTNYSILSNLLRRRVLNGHQWDKLFPPGGTAPDTNTFDITLLFLLLTNICGLTPPLSGWHAKPLPSDTSLEANLARIKFFRNGLYGHVASTGVDTPTFSSLWQEISTVLVSLGLDQAEIVRLKAEHDGEEDYIDALLEWADSEEDIKSQLKDIRQSQTQTEEKLKDVHQSQLKLHETLQEVTSKLEEVSQTQSRTQDILESKLEEVNQKVNITHQAFEEAHQESISWLQGVDESQTKTHQVVAEVRDSIQEVKQEMESLRKEKEREDEVLKSLVKSEFRGDIEYHAQKFQKGTREWIFKSVQKWLDDRTSLNRVMIISGNAGMGKTVIAAVVAQRMQEAGRLSGSHFCQHNNARYRNPRLMLQSLACHLTHALPDYKHALVEQLSRNLGKDLNNMDVQELFALLFREPLSTVDDPGRNILIVIDGLDESEYRGRNELLDVIGNHFSKLPVWIRILITTRPERSITEALQHLKPTQLEQNEEENLNDIQILFQSQLSHKIGEEHKDILLKKLVNKSEGLFIYAYFLIDFIQKNVLFLTPDQLENILPLGISSVYLSYFKRLEQELCIELKADEEHVLRFLCALTASREPLPIESASRILNPSERSLIAQRRVNKAIACISALLPVHDGCLDFFHKSVKDWLTESACYGQHDFTVEEKEGHKVLSNLCASELDSIKRNGVHGRQFNNTEKYALQHGVQHMLEAEQWDDRSGTSDVKAERIYQYVTDIELIYAKLCVKSTSASEDLLSLQNSTLLDKQSHFIVMSLLRLLRKHAYILRDLPHLFFQSLVNEGVPELSSRAASILESQVPKIPYMNYVGSGEEKGALQARFYCSDTIAYFDISPKLDYMVCECRDATIHLWSLQTGNREWVRPSSTMREYYSDHPTGSAFRRIQHRLFLSFYHSVTFHPSGKSVLPGTLQYAYTISGEREDLFPVSDCTFSNCAFSKDKKVILTDCPTEPKRITLWNVENGKERSRIDWKEDISSFAISEDGSLIALSDVTGKIVLVDPVDNSYRNLPHSDAVCGLMHFTYDNNTLVCGFLCLSLEEEYGSYVCDFTE